MRDQWQLLAIDGQWIEDVVKQEHILKLVSKQKTLNFEPCTTFLYCNTGYTLLAEIVKKVSGNPYGIMQEKISSIQFSR